MALASDVTFVGGFPKGEATDRAKVEYFQKLGGYMDKELSQFPRVAFFPFDQAKKILASFHRNRIWVKKWFMHDFLYRHTPRFLHNTVLSTEELATIFHFPGATVTTPTLTRVPSKRAEAPSDLPV